MNTEVVNKVLKRLFDKIAGERLLEENWHKTYNMGLEKAMEIINKEIQNEDSCI